MTRTKQTARKSAGNLNQANKKKNREMLATAQPAGTDGATKQKLGGFTSKRDRKRKREREREASSESDNPLNLRGFEMDNASRIKREPTSDNVSYGGLEMMQINDQRPSKKKFKKEAGYDAVMGPSTKTTGADMFPMGQPKQHQQASFLLPGLFPNHEEKKKSSGESKDDQEDETPLTFLEKALEDISYEQSSQERKQASSSSTGNETGDMAISKTSSAALPHAMANNGTNQQAGLGTAVASGREASTSVESSADPDDSSNASVVIQTEPDPNTKPKSAKAMRRQRKAQLKAAASVQGQQQPLPGTLSNNPKSKKQIKKEEKKKKAAYEKRMRKDKEAKEAKEAAAKAQQSVEEYQQPPPVPGAAPAPRLTKAERKAERRALHLQKFPNDRASAISAKLTEITNGGVVSGKFTGVSAKMRNMSKESQKKHVRKALRHVAVAKLVETGDVEIVKAGLLAAVRVLEKQVTSEGEHEQEKADEVGN